METSTLKNVLIMIYKAIMEAKAGNNVKEKISYAKEKLVWSMEEVIPDNVIWEKTRRDQTKKKATLIKKLTQLRETEQRKKEIAQFEIYIEDREELEKLANVYNMLQDGIKVDLSYDTALDIMKEILERYT